MRKYVKKKALTPEQYERANKAMFIMRKLKGDKKVCMIFMAVTFLIMYCLFVMNNGVFSLVLVFPALVGFMIYLNSNVVALGCLSAFVICAIRCFMFKSAGNIEWYNIANLITMGFVVCIYDSYKAIALLVDDFHKVLDELGEINESMGVAHSAMDGIAGSSENTAEAVNKQADMTGQIQEKLEKALQLLRMKSDSLRRKQKSLQRRLQRL